MAATALSGGMPVASKRIQRIAPPTTVTKPITPTPPAMAPRMPSTRARLAAPVSVVWAISPPLTRQLLSRWCAAFQSPRTGNPHECDGRNADPDAHERAAQAQTADEQRSGERAQQDRAERQRVHDPERPAHDRLGHRALNERLGDDLDDGAGDAGHADDEVCADRSAHQGEGRDR